MAIRLPDFAKLNAQNYNEWMEDITSFFMLTDLSGIVDAIETQPDIAVDPAGHASYAKRKNQAIGVIRLMTEAAQHVHFSTTTDPY